MDLQYSYTRTEVLCLYTNLELAHWEEGALHRDRCQILPPLLHPVAQALESMTT